MLLPRLTYIHLQIHFQIELQLELQIDLQIEVDSFGLTWIGLD